MNTFFERHRRKGLLALLLLLLKRGKGAGPFLLLVALMSFLFILSAGFGASVPWAGRFARALGLNLFGDGGGPRLAGLSDALRVVQANRGPGSRGFWFGGGRGAGAFRHDPAKSSVDMVDGIDLGEPARRGGAGGDERLIKGGGRSVGGILNPDDAKKRENGVSVDPGELEQGLLKAAHAGMFPGGRGPGGSLESVKGGLGRGGSALDPRRQLLDSALGTGSGSSGRGGSAGGMGAGGKLSWKQNERDTRMDRALAALRTYGRFRAVYQLAETRAASRMATMPLCPDSASCPREFSSNSAGMTFVGARGTGDILAGVGLGDEAPVGLDQGLMQLELDKADLVDKETQQCEDTIRDSRLLMRKCNEYAAKACKSALKKCQSCKCGIKFWCCFMKQVRCPECKRIVGELNQEYDDYVEESSRQCPDSALDDGRPVPEIKDTVQFDTECKHN